MRPLKLLLILLPILVSCSEKSEGYYFETQHRNGTKFINGLIHSKLNCDNVNGSVKKIGLNLDVDKDFTYAGVCSKCMTDKKTREFVSYIEGRKYRDKAEKGFEAVYNIARDYFPDVDSIPKNKFIKNAMIDTPFNIERVYNYMNNSAPYRRLEKFKREDINNSRFLFEMEKELFLVRIRRWAEDYLDDLFFVDNEDKEQELDKEYMEDTDWMRDRTQYGVK